MRVTAIADQHGLLPEIEPCDLLLIAGDVCPIDNHAVHHQRYWLRHHFSDWLESLPAKKIVGIAGNHDFAFQEDPDLGFELPWTYLLDSSYIDRPSGLKVYGTPWVPNLPSWAFYADDPTLQDKVDAIPDDVNVLVSHGPPNGMGDQVLGSGSVGSTALSSALSHRLSPKLVVFGHIHEGHGRWDLDSCTLANVSLVDELYEHRWGPMSFEL